MDLDAQRSMARETFKHWRVVIHEADKNGKWMRYSYRKVSKGNRGRPLEGPGRTQIKQIDSP